jgi:hypothetical protein
MNSSPIEFDETPAPKGQCSYRVQKTDCSWSEWKSLAEPIREAHILSFQIGGPPPSTLEYKKFIDQIKIDVPRTGSWPVFVKGDL